MQLIFGIFFVIRLKKIKLNKNLRLDSCIITPQKVVPIFQKKLRYIKYTKNSFILYYFTLLKSKDNYVVKIGFIDKNQSRIICKHENVLVNKLMQYFSMIFFL